MIGDLRGRINKIMNIMNMYTDSEEVFKNTMKMTYNNGVACK